MADTDDIDRRLKSLEREVRCDWKQIVSRLSHIEADVKVLRERDNHTSQVSQSRQQDRWTGALWIVGWGLVTGTIIAGVIVAFLRYQQ